MLESCSHFAQDIKGEVERIVDGDWLYGEDWKKQRGGNNDQECRGNLISKLLKVCRDMASAYKTGPDHDFSEDSIVASMLALDMSTLERSCSNAEPNYGSMWTDWRLSPLDSPAVVFGRARREIALEIRESLAFYLESVGRRHGVEKLLEKEIEAKEVKHELEAEDLWQMLLDKRLMEAPGTPKRYYRDGQTSSGRNLTELDGQAKRREMLQWMLSSAPK